MKLGIVTATVDRERAEPCIQSWLQNATSKPELTVVESISTFIGPVAAFLKGVEKHMRQYDSDVIAVLHDDLVIFDYGWDVYALAAFEVNSQLGLAGFGGWPALGRHDLYQADYNPEQLAGLDYVSNLTDAEKWGARSTTPAPVVAVSPFSQIGRRPFFSGFYEAEWRTKLTRRKVLTRPWELVAKAGIIDHFYAGALGCLARRGGWQVLALPTRCRHLGRQTTGDTDYQEWAAHAYDGGDRGIWETAHRIGYAQFKDVLPLRLPA